jgi:hypothetical protein
VGWSTILEDLKDDPDLSHIIDILRRLRSIVQTQGPTDGLPYPHPNEFFSDFAAHESWQLFYAFGRALDLVRDGMPCQQIEHRISSYNIAVQVAARPSASIGRTLALMGVSTRSDLILNYTLGIDQMMFAWGPRVSLRCPTAAWKTLRALRTPGAVRGKQ